LIKYLGSKRLLLPWILALVDALPGVRSVLDLFSGTSRVGHALKARGLQVIANDHNAYAHVLARCYVEADRRRVRTQALRGLAEMERVPPRAGWFVEHYCRRARYLRPENGARIEAMREHLARTSIESDVEAVLLTALLEAADRVDSTTGVQMAYLKRWAPRALRAIELRMPALLPGRGLALGREAADAAGIEVDLAYLDPPYNQHSYRGNYHVWETLVRWDAPDTYGVAEKRVDCRTRRSGFNSRRTIAAELLRVLEALRARHVILSFNDEGHLDTPALESLLAPFGPAAVLEVDHPRYVGARIGIYNPSGVKVGRPGRLRNHERLYVLTRDARDLAGVIALGARPVEAGVGAGA
jgi:adenine-specific DNA-methyltransferase